MRIRSRTGPRSAHPSHCLRIATTETSLAKIALTGGLDDFLRRRGITHPLIVPILRNQLLILLVLFFISSAFATESLTGIWFCSGFAVITYILYSWANFFSRSRLDNFGSAFFGAVIVRFTLRLFILGAGIYALLILAKANPMLFLAGVVVGTFAPLLTWAVKRGTK